MTNTNYPTASTNPPSTPPRAKGNKNLVIGILAAGLLGTWGYLLYDKNQSAKKIDDQQTQITKVTDEKSELQNNFNASLARLDSITGANNSLQGEKTALQKDIDAKKAEIRKILNDKNATAAQLQRARNLIADLNGKISSLEAEVTRLTGENQELNVANTTLRQEKADLEANITTMSAQTEDLAKTVDVASTFSASNIQVRPVDEKKSGKEKETTTAKRVDKLVVSFDVENRIAQSGPADMYLIVTAPDGKVVSTNGTMATRMDGDKPFTARLPIEYTQGQRKTVQFPITSQDFATGDYRIEIYHNGFKIGEGVRSLKKGGLFG
jgi:hypothetical protein